MINADDFINGSSQLDLNEIGPFVFRERRTRRVLVENANTIKFERNFDYEFVPELSNGLDLDQNVTIVNIPFITLIQKLIDQSYGQRNQLMINMVSTIVRQLNIKPFVTRTVREVLFDGYVDPLIERLTHVAAQFRIPLTSPLINNTFGLLIGTSTDGHWAIDRGLNSVREVGLVREWNNLT